MFSISEYIRIGLDGPEKGRLWTFGQAIVDSVIYSKNSIHDAISKSLRRLSAQMNTVWTWTVAAEHTVLVL